MLIVGSVEAEVTPEKNEGEGNVVNEHETALSNDGMEAGVQPLDALMMQRRLTNHDLVLAAVGTGLTHKQVAKARRGRKLTMHMQNKIVSALNELSGETAPVRREDCFNYRGH